VADGGEDRLKVVGELAELEDAVAVGVEALEQLPGLGLVDRRRRVRDCLPLAAPAAAHEGLGGRGAGDPAAELGEGERPVGVLVGLLEAAHRRGLGHGARRDAVPGEGLGVADGGEDRLKVVGELAEVEDAVAVGVVPVEEGPRVRLVDRPARRERQRGRSSSRSRVVSRVLGLGRRLGAQLGLGGQVLEAVLRQLLGQGRRRRLAAVVQLLRPEEADEGGPVLVDAALEQEARLEGPDEAALFAAGPAPLGPEGQRRLARLEGAFEVRHQHRGERAHHLQRCAQVRLRLRDRSLRVLGLGFGDRREGFLGRASDGRRGLAVPLQAQGGAVLEPPLSAVVVPGEPPHAQP